MESLSTTPDSLETLASLNLTKGDIRLYTSLFAGTGTLSGLATTILLVLTFLTSTRDNMKVSEKMLIYNVLVSDLIYEIIVVTILTPCIKQNEWTFNEFKTTWIAFISTTCIFHSHLAIAFICDLIVLSLTDSYRFHASDNALHMSALVLSTVCISLSICSLPACEEQGYIFTTSWLAPSFNLKFQYGSILMLVIMVLLVVCKQGINLLKMMQVRSFFILNSNKITERAMKEMDRLILFTVLATINLVFSLPAMLGGMPIIVTVVLELVIIISPVIRVYLLYFMCPHFHFGTSGSDDEFMDEFAIISTDENDIIPLDTLTEHGAPTHTSI